MGDVVEAFARSDWLGLLRHWLLALRHERSQPKTTVIDVEGVEVVPTAAPLARAEPAPRQEP